LASRAVHVEELRELERAFALADRELRNDLRDALEEAATPVRADAQTIAGSGVIRNLRSGQPWTRMRTGVGRSVAYVVPAERGVKARGNAKRRRPNFGDMLMGRAMEPALERNVENVQARFAELLDDVCRVWDRA
jgi:hypothetical protein